MAILTPSEYNENYYNGRNTGIKLAWGYADIREHGQLNKFDIGNESQPYNENLKEQFDKLAGMNLSNISVLDVGGAIGNYSNPAKRLGVESWTVLDYNIDGWCEANKLPTVDSFITGDAKVVLPTINKNKYDVIFTSQVLECIDDADLPDMIAEMNRVAKIIQIHFVTTSINDIPSQAKYNTKSLAEWGLMGFKSGTRLIDIHSSEMLVV